MISNMGAARFANKLAGQRILLVGGTGGVGISVARALVEYGAAVILSSSRETKVKDVCAQLMSEYSDAADRVTGFACDLAGPSVEANIEQLFTKVGEVNHIVYMAGDRLPMVPLDDVTLEKWQKCNQVRTISSILVAKIGSRYLKKDRHSSIVFTGGSISEKPIPGGWAMLALIGAGINGLARQLAFDLAPVRVNCVALGVVETDLWHGMGEEGKKAFFADHESKLATGKVGQPEDTAEAYLYCLRDANLTGSVVHSNGGNFLM
jgi:NAD(P)-dependent dehydrogenase (short-subunit alcohol dehydrogenase family)